MMIISLNWLKDYIKINYSPEELAEKLTLAGLEVEDFYTIQTPVGDDAVFKLEITPNRPDLLGYIGIAREISAFSGLKVHLPKIDLVESDKDIHQIASVEIQDPDTCFRYLCRIIYGVKIAESPQWLKQRLIAQGVNPINNIVDITNFVLFECGQPLHAFDLDKLASPKIIVRRAKNGERITTLDEIDRILTEDNLLIADEKKPIALAGIIGGWDTSIDPLTKNVLIEAACFAPSVIRKSSKIAHHSTESSYRFERGTDPEDMLVFALNRAASLMQKTAGGTLLKGFVDNYPKKIERKMFQITSSIVHSLLGIEIDKKAIIRYLKALNMEVDQNLNVKVPTFRRDITEPVVLVEDIARLYGYDNIPSSYPLTRTIFLEKDPSSECSLKVRKVLNGYGLQEVVTLTFTCKEKIESLAIPYEEEKLVKVINPLSKDENILRPTIIPSLVDILKINQNKDELDVKIFEIGRVFTRIEGQIQPKEKLHLAGVLTGNILKQDWKHIWNVVDFYSVKGIIEGIFSNLDVGNPVFKFENYPFLHPFISASIYCQDQLMGYVGRLHPDREIEMELVGKVYLFEIDLDRILTLQKEEKIFKPLPKFPAVMRDIAIIVGMDIEHHAIWETIKKAGGEYLEEVRLFDYYTGKPVPEGMKSLAFSLSFRSYERTLTAEEVNLAFENIVRSLELEFKAVLRK